MKNLKYQLLKKHLNNLYTLRLDKFFSSSKIVFSIGYEVGDDVVILRKGIKEEINENCNYARRSRIR